MVKFIATVVRVNTGTTTTGSAATFITLADNSQTPAVFYSLALFGKAAEAAASDPRFVGEKGEKSRWGVTAQSVVETPWEANGKSGVNRSLRNFNLTPIVEEARVSTRPMTAQEFLAS